MGCCNAVLGWKHNLAARLEVSQRLLGALVLAKPAHVAVHAVGVREVGLRSTTAARLSILTIVHVLLLLINVTQIASTTTQLYSRHADSGNNLRYSVAP